MAEALAVLDRYKVMLEALRDAGDHHARQRLHVLWWARHDIVEDGGMTGLSRLRVQGYKREVERLTATAPEVLQPGVPRPWEDGIVTGKPEVAAWFVDEPVADDDLLRAVKERAQQLCDPHYQAGQCADRLEEAVGLFADEAFDPRETWDAGLAVGQTDADLDAAAYVGMMLWLVENRRD